MSEQDPFARGKHTPGFNATTPEDVKPHIGDSNAMAALNKIEAGLQAARRDLADVMKRNEAQWRDHFRAQVAEEYAHPEPELAPPGLRKSIDQETERRLSQFKRQLVNNVEENARAQREALTGDPNGTRQEISMTQQQNDPLAKFDTQMKDGEKTVEAKVDDTVRRARRIRNQANYEFNQNKKDLIEQAKEAGSENPVRDVYRAHAAKMKEIDRAEDQARKTAFREQGRDAPNQNQDQSGPSMG